MKSAQDCTRTIQLVGLALAAFGIGLACPARAQQDVDQRFQIPPPAPRATAPDPQMANVKKSMDLRDVKVPGVRPARIPVNPTDAIAIVNGQEISRQQLADECVARE
ncbi:MAG TPA: hypothetical protein VFF52_08520, partial [Isosphaeraceae bacterium]|nr:hypothetical protein [Isosphaeraceae bacterium]